MIRRLRKERGAIALMTLAFLVFAGLSALFILWGIARVTGAYNLMYAANQSASYAAVTAVESGTRIRCNNPDPNISVVCLRSTDPSAQTDAYAVASSVMAASINPEEQQTFGLCYSNGPNECSDEGSVRLVSDFAEPAARDDAIKVFNVDSSEEVAELCGALQDDVFRASRPGSPLICWGLEEAGVTTLQRTSGVITRAEASLPLGQFIGCQDGGAIDFLPCIDVNLRVASSARQTQPRAESSY